MNTPFQPSLSSTISSTITNNYAQAEFVDSVRNDSMIYSLDDAMRARENQQHNVESALAKKTELLPFTVKIVSTEAELAKAVKLRHEAYARHAPEMAAKFADPEEADSRDIVLLVESKFDGSALGTMRIYTNDAAPLPIEGVIEMPAHMQGCRLAGASRLAVKGAGGGLMVRDTLFKAFYQICQQLDVDYMVISARRPLDRMYERLDFADLREEDEQIPLPYAANIPHRVMVSEVKTFYSRWTESNHPLCDFIWNSNHPDIRIDVADKRMHRYEEPALNVA